MLFFEKNFCIGDDGRIIAVGIFVKCSAPQRLFDQCAKPGLRAKSRFLRFARKMQISVTGKKPIFEICP